MVNTKHSHAGIKKKSGFENKEAFNGTLKQWGLISQAMPQGAENMHCFCDYTLTFTDIFCFGESIENLSCASFVCN